MNTILLQQTITSIKSQSIDNQSNDLIKPLYDNLSSDDKNKTVYLLSNQFNNAHSSPIHKIQAQANSFNDDLQIKQPPLVNQLLFLKEGQYMIQFRNIDRIIGRARILHRKNVYLIKWKQTPTPPYQEFYSWQYTSCFAGKKLHQLTQQFKNKGNNKAQFYFDPDFIQHQDYFIKKFHQKKEVEIDKVLGRLITMKNYVIYLVKKKNCQLETSQWMPYCSVHGKENQIKITQFNKQRSRDDCIIDANAIFQIIQGNKKYKKTEQGDQLVKHLKQQIVDKQIIRKETDELIVKFTEALNRRLQYFSRSYFKMYNMRFDFKAEELKKQFIKCQQQQDFEQKDLDQQHYIRLKSQKQQNKEYKQEEDIVNQIRPKRKYKKRKPKIQQYTQDLNGKRKLRKRRKLQFKLNEKIVQTQLFSQDIYDSQQQQKRQKQQKIQTRSKKQKKQQQDQQQNQQYQQLNHHNSKQKRYSKRLKAMQSNNKKQLLKNKIQNKSKIQKYHYNNRPLKNNRRKLIGNYQSQTKQNQSQTKQIYSSNKKCQKNSKQLKNTNNQVQNVSDSSQSFVKLQYIQKEQEQENQSQNHHISLKYKQKNSIKINQNHSQSKKSSSKLSKSKQFRNFINPHNDVSIIQQKNSKKNANLVSENQAMKSVKITILQNKKELKVINVNLMKKSDSDHQQTESDENLYKLKYEDGTTKYLSTTQIYSMDRVPIQWIKYIEKKMKQKVNKKQ